MGNLKISGLTTETQDWVITDIIGDYTDRCIEEHEKTTYGSETSRNDMTYWEVNRFKDYELAMEYDRKRM